MSTVAIGIARIRDRRSRVAGRVGVVPRPAKGVGRRQLKAGMMTRLEREETAVVARAADRLQLVDLLVPRVGTQCSDRRRDDRRRARGSEYPG